MLGYLDILVDFTVYGLIPVGIVYGNPSDSKWLILSLLLVTYFVNSAGLFYLSAIIEKNVYFKDHFCFIFRMLKLQKNLLQ